MKSRFNLALFLGVMLLLIFSAACSTSSLKKAAEDEAEVIHPEVSTVFPSLANYRVVLVGEYHDRLDNHVVQLDVIKYLFSVNQTIAIGLEFFQQPYQAVLDEYVNGTINEQQMLEQSEYFSRWGYDYRLYAPILRFARENRIPLIALNVPAEVSRKTARSGLDSLDENESLYVPANMDFDVPGYRERIQESLEMHSDTMQVDLSFFHEAQLLWDEAMANRAAEYLGENPSRQMVILAGAGHVEDRNGIPVRLERRISSPVVTVIPDSTESNRESLIADFYVNSPEMQLPAKGLIGIMLDADEKGVLAQSINEGSAAQKAGILANDYIRRINGVSITSFEQLRLSMWNRVPGETIVLAIERDSESGSQSLEFNVTLD